MNTKHSFRRTTKLGYVLILLCLLASNLVPNSSVFARGESAGLQVGADMSGDWVGTDQTTSGQTFSFTLNVIQSDNQLIGTCVYSDGPTCTITGTVNGLSVIWTRTDVGISYQAYFSGTLSSDYQTMSGTWSDTNGVSGNWQAVKQGQSIHIVSDSTVKYSETEISGWQATTFDDSTWPNVVAPSIGLCPLTTGGGGRIPGSLALPVWRPDPDQYQTIYARKTFTIQNPTSAIMKTLIDDDFDLYVNSVLVLSNWDNQASYIDVDISAFLQSGVNSIAFKASDTVGGCQSLAFDVTIGQGSSFMISGNAGIAGAVLSYTDGVQKTALADADGNYSFSIPSGWSDTVTPSKDGYTFLPSNRTYNNVLANQTNQDYIAKLPVIDYFALGDSIASGHGLGDDLSACRRSVVRGYPWLVRNELLKRYTTVNFQLDHWLACSGATAMRPDNKTLKQDSNKWLENQVTYAITHLIPDHPTLVTITIGSNDFGWADPAKFLSHLYVQQGDAYVQWVDGVVGDYTSGRELIVRAQVARLLAYDNVSVVITGIHNPFNQTSLLFALPSGNDCGLWAFACYTRTEYSVTKLNGAMIDIAFRTNLPSRLRFAPVELKFQLDGGHQSPSPNCGTSLPTTAQTWIQYPGDPNSNSISLLPNWIIKRLPQKYGGDCFHPNDLGAAAYADAVNTAAMLVGR